MIRNQIQNLAASRSSFGWHDCVQHGHTSLPSISESQFANHAAAFHAKLAA